MPRKPRPVSSAPRGGASLSIGEDDGRVALLIDGVVQSVAVTAEPLTFGYWPLMLPEFAPRNALILGFGGGTIAGMLVKRFGALPITAVEVDPAVASLAYASFDIPRSVELVVGDALMQIHEIRGPFDYVAVDLFSEGVVPAAIFASPFLRRVKEITRDGGLVAINYFEDGRATAHRHRLERVFPRIEVVTSGKNLIARCRVR